MQAKPTPPKCPLHGLGMKLCYSAHGWFYACPNPWVCEMKCSADQKTKRPSGAPGDNATRAARREAYIWFMRLGNIMHSKEMERWFQSLTGKPHVGFLDKKQCNAVIYEADRQLTECENNFDPVDGVKERFYS